ncbi:MAG: divergent polysaccharide deacetylase family protein [Candidatus Symbiobacter sp.]|nr:divergent polysaccharide deacetylase family protein [Candidatus Symbiobacter sp.]
MNAMVYSRIHLSGLLKLLWCCLLLLVVGVTLWLFSGVSRNNARVAFEFDIPLDAVADGKGGVVTSAQSQEAIIKARRMGVVPQGSDTIMRPHSDHDIDAITNAPRRPWQAGVNAAKILPSFMIDKGALPPAPDPKLVAASDYGPLPVIDAEGRKPLAVYAKAFDNKPKRGLVTLIVASIGSNREVSEMAIARLPGRISLAVNPYAPEGAMWLAKARSNGHETLLALPMEPNDYPSSDPGPATLLTQLTPQENRQRLEWVLSRGTGYVGVLAWSGLKFLNSAKDLIPMLQILHQRGLLLVDNQPEVPSRAARMARDIGVPRAMVNRRILADMSPALMDRALADLQAIAADTGQAVGVFEQPTLDQIARLSDWAATLNEDKVVLAPVSSVVDLQADKPIVSIETLRAAAFGP